MFLPSSVVLQLPLQNPICVYPFLAKKVGLVESMFLVQLHYLLQQNENNPRCIKENRVWISYTSEEWQEKCFPWLSYKNFMGKIFAHLEKMELIIRKDLNVDREIRTKSCTINYERLIAFIKD